MNVFLQDLFSSYEVNYGGIVFHDMKTVVFLLRTGTPIKARYFLIFLRI